MEIQNRKIPEGEFMAMRQEVLQQWPTGRDVDLTEAAAYQKQQKPSRNFSARLIEAKKRLLDGLLDGSSHPAACRCAGA
jgi:methylaspartate mutase epsilon subunit